MKTIIAGSRSITEYDLLAKAMEMAHWKVTEVVCGCAMGVDSLGMAWAAQRGIPVKEFPADWVRHGKAAGFKRNWDMANYGEALVALWDGESKGTLSMIGMAVDRKLKLVVVTV